MCDKRAHSPQQYITCTSQSVYDRTQYAECGNDIESADDLVAQEVKEVDTDDDGSVNVYGNERNLYLCSNCRKPMGIGRSGD